jgi:hypothetical protein
MVEALFLIPCSMAKASNPNFSTCLNSGVQWSNLFKHHAARDVMNPTQGLCPQLPKNVIDIICAISDHLK